MRLHTFASGIFLLISLVLGLELVGLTMPMVIDSEKVAADACLFAPGDQPCTMTVGAHLTSWQSLTTTLPPEVPQALLILTLIVFVVWLPFLHRTDPPERRSDLLQSNLPESYLFSYLAVALADGILEPKLYA